MNKYAIYTPKNLNNFLVSSSSLSDFFDYLEMSYLRDFLEPGPNKVHILQLSLMTYKKQFNNIQ